MKELTLVLTAFVSGATVTCACSVEPVGGGWIRFSVNPEIAVVIELVEEVSDKPLMLYTASAAPWVSVRFWPAPAAAVGSNAICDSQEGSVLLPFESAK